MKDLKERKERILLRTNDLRKSTAFEVDAIRELLDLLFEEAKDTMVGANGDELIRIQGEAKAMERLFKQLTRPVLATRKEQ